jgi:hypothetical protein
MKPSRSGARVKANRRLKACQRTADRGGIGGSNDSCANTYAGEAVARMHALDDSID